MYYIITYVYVKNVRFLILHNVIKNYFFMKRKKPNKIKKSIAI